MPGTLPTTWLASAPATSITDDAAHLADERVTTNRGHNDDNNAHRAKTLPSKHNDNAGRMTDKRARERAGRLKHYLNSEKELKHYLNLEKM